MLLFTTCFWQLSKWTICCASCGQRRNFICTTSASTRIDDRVRKIRKMILHIPMKFIYHRFLIYGSNDVITDDKSYYFLIIKYTLARLTVRCYVAI